MVAAAVRPHETSVLDALPNVMPRNWFAVKDVDNVRSWHNNHIGSSIRILPFVMKMVVTDVIVRLRR